MKVLLVCDRSGGHIFPAVAVAKKFREKSTKISQDLPGKETIAYEDEVSFFVTSQFLRDYLEKEGFLVYGRFFKRRNLIMEMFYRFFEAVILLFRLRPQKIIGFGGRDSFFLLLFGSLLFLDTAIYEPNLRFGKANRVLSFVVRKTFCGFAQPPLNKRIKVVGIPLRDNIKLIQKSQALKVLGFNDQPVIFCLGGSQGSHFLNTIFMKLLVGLQGEYQVIHLTGEREYFKIYEFYNKIERKSFVKDFHYAVEVLYSAADVVVCRAGASTLAELTYYTLPAVLIPHPAAGGHQRDNAFYFAKRGAAYLMLQEDFSFEEFKNTVEKILYDRRERDRLKQNLRSIKLGVNFEDFCHDTCF
jgi:UDP-N-acetylglucosamine--N-acetylmuramyl-(pentapeptide) pyrophosphoryl-undecaprenol N-acetylglucosamine transferase